MIGIGKRNQPTGYGYGYGYGQGRAGAGSSERTGAGTFFGLMRAWAVAIVVLVVLHAVFSALWSEPMHSDGPTSLGSRVLLFYAPGFLTVALACFAAAKIHPSPGRERPLLHLLAAAGVPVVNRLLTTLTAYDNLTTEAVLVPACTVLAGCVLGLALDRLLTRD